MQSSVRSDQLYLIQSKSKSHKDLDRWVSLPFPVSSCLKQSKKEAVQCIVIKKHRVWVNQCKRDWLSRLMNIDIILLLAGRLSVQGLASLKWQGTAQVMTWLQHTARCKYTTETVENTKPNYTITRAQAFMRLKGFEVRTWALMK